MKAPSYCFEFKTKNYKKKNIIKRGEKTKIKRKEKKTEKMPLPR